MAIGFFVKVKGIEEASAFGPFSSELDRRVAFEGPFIGGCDLY
jgi:hypothetical protein